MEEIFMEIDAHILDVIALTCAEDYAVYCLKDGALDTLLFSPKLSALSDMTLQEYQALTGKDATAIVLDSDRPLVAAKLAELLRGGDSSAVYTLTYRIFHKSHGFAWVRAKARRIGEYGGAPVLMASFSTVDAASMEYANLLDHTAISVYVIDKHTHELLYVNENALQSSRRVNYQNAQCFRFLNGLEAPCPWCSLPRMENGTAHVEENYVPPLNRWYRHDVRDISWYGRDAAAFYITDITELKRRQQQDEERFSNLCRQIVSTYPNALSMTRLNLTKNTCADVQSRDKQARQAAVRRHGGRISGRLRGEHLRRKDPPGLADQIYAVQSAAGISERRHRTVRSNTRSVRCFGGDGLGRRFPHHDAEFRQRRHRGDLLRGKCHGPEAQRQHPGADLAGEIRSHRAHRPDRAHL
jgi:hypothetical protein